ncbi:MAG: hypothetical protein CMG02_00600 [Candidatus Marinimicrobia bacterium]|nr:hypothetical protein [Candidatus Neomarinimicrobiota bacterium]RPG05402.1 MAG: hypothetical protein CBE07_002235 [Pelagibacteraceae bacterium TMED247]|tara:strand:+ start:9469 stop:10068 length:600 start_codon:yes stop_codon:yes gene_type:complete
MKMKNFFVLLSFVFLTFLPSTFASENESIISVGEKDAKITIKVFSSLTCPHCANFHKEIFKKLKKDYIDTKIARFEHHGFPLDLAALNAEKVLNCFKNNKKKLNFLNEIYEKQDVWASGADINSINSNLIKIGKNHDLNNDTILNCLNDENLEEKILNERIMANKKYSIQSTPTVYVNGKKYEGKHNYRDFKKVIEKFL